jgi:hypothetical protein
MVWVHHSHKNLRDHSAPRKSDDFGGAPLDRPSAQSAINNK